MANTFHSIVVKKIKQETLDSVVITFRVPINLKSHYLFKAGQYLTLKANIGGDLIKRSYSICSSPNSGLLQIGAKALSKGIFSNYLNNALREGDSLEVSKPEGRFVFENTDKHKNYCGFASGSGITPLLSIIHEVLLSNSNNCFVLAYGNKSKASTMFLQEVERFQNTFKDRFFCYYTYSQESNSNAAFGRIDSSFVRYTLKQHSSLSFDKIYLCGPEKMIENTVETLENSGYNKKKIAFELFYTKSSDKILNSNSAQAQIHYDDEVFEITIPKKMTILDAALQKNLDVPYSCQGGVCSSCIAKITSGSANMIQNNILTDSEVEEGLILTCQAIPSSKKITINYDDV
tara:strand:- start:1007 stop:2047 length:1041 start_codon:yes stop_codon:yes gene_type:complete